MSAISSAPPPLMLGLSLAVATALAGATRAKAEAQLLIEASTGKVLHAENATYPWYPASVTKLMTAYTTLHAVKEGRISFNTLLTLSRNAAAPAADQNGIQDRHHCHGRQCSQDVTREICQRYRRGDRGRRRWLDRGISPT